MSLGENPKIPNVRISTSRKLSTNDDSTSKKSIEKKLPKPEANVTIIEKRNRLLPLPDIRSPTYKKQQLPISPSRLPPPVPLEPNNRRNSNCKSKARLKIQQDKSVKSSAENLIMGSLPLVIESPQQFQQLEETAIRSKKPNEKREEQERRNILQSSPMKMFTKEKSNPFERWKIGQMIGAGSTSEVYKVFDSNTGIIVAGKKITLFDEPELEKSIKSELNILCGIQHPNIVKFYDHYQQPDGIWFFMEYIPETLELIYRNYGGVTPDNARQYTKQLLSAIKYLHDNKVIHKDIKCSNVLISSEGVIKLSDFGSSKKFDQTNSTVAYNVNGAMTFRGSVLWMAPEVMKDNKYGRKSDIWSFGCTVLEMLTAKTPWADKNYDNEMNAILDIGLGDEIPKIPQNLPESLKDFLGQCLVRDPEKRASAEQLLQSKFLNS